MTRSGEEMRWRRQYNYYNYDEKWRGRGRGVIPSFNAAACRDRPRVEKK